MVCFYITYCYIINYYYLHFCNTGFQVSGNYSSILKIVSFEINFQQS